MLRWLTKQPSAARIDLLASRHWAPTSQLRLPLQTSAASKQNPTSAPGQLGSGGRLALLDSLA